jgi:hypothetical protein
VSKIWDTWCRTNAHCKSSDNQRVALCDARSHTLSSVQTSPKEGKCEHATNEDIFGLAIARRGRTAGNFFGGTSNLPGQRVRRKAVIGTVQQYPNIEEAWRASNGLRVSINEARNRQQEQLVTVADLVDHYTRTELGGDPSHEGKSHATKTVYPTFPF